MKNLLKIALAAVLLLGAPAAANAQFKGLGKKLKEKAKQKVEQKIDQIINKTIDNAVDKTGDAIEGQVNKVVKKGKEKVTGKVVESTGASQNGTSSSSTSVGPKNMDDYSIFLPSKDERFQQFWELTDEQAKKNQKTFQRLMIAKGKNYGSETPAAFRINYITLEDGTVVPEDEEFLNAWYCKFISEPASNDAIENVLQAMA